MPISVRATVISILDDTPRPEDVFLLDTNVLYWTCYTRALDLASAQRQDHKARAYSDYVNRALLAGARLTKCVVSLTELAHVIERDECAIFNQRFSTDFTLKKYRQESGERGKVVEEIQTAWSLAEGITERRVLPVTTDVEALRGTLSSAAVDGYDLLIYHAALSGNARQILTDDVDYGELSDVQIFTANEKLIDLAREQGKLRTR
jgi:hypothetical protein